MLGRVVKLLWQVLLLRLLQLGLSLRQIAGLWVGSHTSSDAGVSFSRYLVDYSLLRITNHLCSRLVH